MMRILLTLLLLPILAKCLRKHSHKKVPRPCSSDYAADKAAEVDSGVHFRPPQAVDHQTKGNEQEHRKTEQRYWKYSLCLLWIGLVTSSIGVVSALLTLRELGLQTRTAIATSRPWMVYDVEKDGPLTRDVAGLHTNVNAGIRNIGHSPALKVKSVLFPVVGEDALNRSDHTCAALTDGRFADVGRVFFADDTTKKASNGETPRRLDFKTENGLGKAPTGEVYVLACIIYEIGDGSPHETRRIFSFSKTDPRDPGKRIPLNGNYDVSFDDLMLVDRIDGDKAD